jgi:hypothetical protein
MPSFGKMGWFRLVEFVESRAIELESLSFGKNTPASSDPSCFEQPESTGIGIRG